MVKRLTGSATAVCLYSGSVFSLAGGWAIVNFFFCGHGLQELRTVQFLQKVILPHIALLLGLGLLAAAFILSRRAAIIRKRLQHEPV